MSITDSAEISPVTTSCVAGDDTSMAAGATTSEGSRVLSSLDLVRASLGLAGGY